MGFIVMTLRAWGGPCGNLRQPREPNGDLDQSAFAQFELSAKVVMVGQAQLDVLEAQQSYPLASYIYTELVYLMAYATILSS